METAVDEGSRDKVVFGRVPTATVDHRCRPLRRYVAPEKGWVGVDSLDWTLFEEECFRRFGRIRGGRI